MKELKISLVLSVIFFVSCSQKQQASNEIVPTPTPSPISEDENGNAINRDGWRIPVLEDEKKEKGTRKEIQEDGTELVIRTIEYRPIVRVVADLPPHGRDADWMITQVTELSFKSQRPFCYEYSASPFIRGGNGIGVTVRYRICDYDGDGIYEFKGSGFRRTIVPAWAKSTN